MEKLKIGMTLSGGGVRATAFHLGVLKFLAEKEMLENITFISSVSGGSLAIGLVFTKANNKWPSSSEFLDLYLQFKSALTEHKIQKKFTIQSLIKFKFPFWGRADVLGNLLKSEWGINATLKEIPNNTLRWIINCTTYETGKNWIFSSKRMGDYISGYVLNPEIDLAYCLAASAGVPGLIGPLTISTKKFNWVKFGKDQKAIENISPKFEKIRLWDGGVYDNLGLEPLFKLGSGYRDGISFLIVSDASAKVFQDDSIVSCKPPFYKPPFRLIDISGSQIRALRLRIFFEHLNNNPQSGAILNMGISTKEIKQSCKIPNNFQIPENHMSDEHIEKVKNFETTLRVLSQQEFEQLSQHGYEVAQATLLCNCPDKFN